MVIKVQGVSKKQKVTIRCVKLRSTRNRYSKSFHWRAREQTSATTRF